MLLLAKNVSKIFNEVEVGNAYATKGGHLKQTTIVHLAIPVWRGVKINLMIREKMVKQICL